MKKPNPSARKSDTSGSLGQKDVISGDEVKTRLREKGMTLKEWAKKRGYPYDTVSCVVRGINRGTYGMGHRIAVELGLKRA